MICAYVFGSLLISGQAVSQRYAERVADYKKNIGYQENKRLLHVLGHPSKVHFVCCWKVAEASRVTFPASSAKQLDSMLVKFILTAQTIVLSSISSQKRSLFVT